MLLCALSVLLCNVGSHAELVSETPHSEGAEIPPEDMFGPVTDPCEMCRNLTSVPVERDISPEEFMDRYTYAEIPVLIKDATTDWRAMSTFSFKFFQRLYTETKGALETLENKCQFFPLNTEFETLRDVLNMSDARASFQPGEEPWYIGWGNCHEVMKEKLRQHYQRPHFLPTDFWVTVDKHDTNWIFMGGAGPGSPLHVDEVGRPSWQAQISGRKTWQLAPKPECESVCRSLNVTLEKGDIIILETSSWYHGTFIHPGEISISIGGEFERWRR